MKSEKVFGIAGILTLIFAIVLGFTYGTVNPQSATSGANYDGIDATQLNSSLAVPAGVYVTNSTVNVTENATILVETGPMSGGANMFSFVMYGESNPAIMIEEGVTVHFKVVNIDTDAYHNLAITSDAPPYPEMGPGMMYYDTMMSTPFLPPHTGSQYYESVTTFHAIEAGNFWYICQEYGHASNGMYGQFNVYP